MVLSAPILVGTFHKTGTHLMYGIWRSVCTAFGLGFWGLADRSLAEPAAWYVAMDDHSEFRDLPARGPHRGILVIRDPRDIAISAAHFHAVAPEAWLDAPRPKLGGRSYRAALVALPSLEARIGFELGRTARQTARQMLEAMARYPEFVVLRYEALAEDREMADFRAMFAHAGFGEDAMPRLLEIAGANSVFSGAVPRSHHVRDGRAAQWRSVFTPALHAAASRTLGDAPARLGYPAG